jgi:CheY-like chemotaxis protein/two-component sensor histidine kinase
MEAIGTLAGGVAHDMNNTLAIVHGMAELLLEKTEAENPLHGDVEILLDAARRGAALTQNLLAYSRKNTLQQTAFCLNTTVTRTIQLLSRTISKRIEIHLSLDEHLENVIGDSDQFSQVLVNLCLNAVDAMQGKGQLSILTSMAEDNTAENSPKRVCLQVNDTGEGIPREILPRVFEPFFTTKARGKGTGLGLSMVYATVQQHSGTIHCDSTPGIGTTFTILLPSAGHAIDEDTKPQGDLHISSQLTGCVLFVDDESAMRAIGRRALKELGYAVLTAANGEEAVNIFRARRQEITLVILDMEMPVMDGAECFTELKAISPEVNVVIISGYSSSERITRALNDGALAYLKKPFELTEFTACVGKISKRLHQVGDVVAEVSCSRI